MAFQLDLMPLEEKPPEPPAPKNIVVRYGFLKEIGEFPSDITQKVGCGTKLILRTDRGTEIGEMLTTLCGNGGCNKSITRDKLLDYIEKSGGRDYPFTESGRVLRVATVQDLAEQARLDENHHKHLALARELTLRHNLNMKIVDVEHVLGGERILFYFISEHRIDFRSMVRDLAHDLHTRIEMRQVGARDEARLTADYEKCGQHCCCKQFLKVLTPISMRSAKVQKATLDPTKISGRCGRLMCCLRYEDETYEELRKKLPRRNTRVKTEKGDGWVIDGQILTQLVLVQFDDSKREAIPMEKILGFDQPKPVMADGRTMQTPNDRPAGQFPMQAGPVRPGGPPPRGAPSAPPPPAQRERPRPGAPAPAAEGDPRALTGPTGGDLNTGSGIDDLLADALDAAAPAVDPEASSDPRSEPPLPPANAARPPVPPPGGPRQPPMNRPPQNSPQRPPQQRPRGGGPRPPQQPFNQPPRGPRPPQKFNPPKPPAPQPPRPPAAQQSQPPQQPPSPPPPPAEPTNTPPEP